MSGRSERGAPPPLPLPLERPGMVSPVPLELVEPPVRAALPLPRVHSRVRLNGVPMTGIATRLAVRIRLLRTAGATRSAARHHPRTLAAPVYSDKHSHRHVCRTQCAMPQPAMLCLAL